MLIFSVTLSTYPVIYSEKYALYLGKFENVLEVFQGLFFAFLLKQKDALGTRLVEKVLPKVGNSEKR